MTLLREAEGHIAKRSAHEQELEKRTQLLATMFDDAYKILFPEYFKKSNPLIKAFQKFNLPDLSRTKTVDLKTTSGKSISTTIDTWNEVNMPDFSGEFLNIKVEGLPTYLHIAKGGRIVEGLPKWGSNIVSVWSTETHNPTHTIPSKRDVYKYHEIMGLIKSATQPSAHPSL